MRIGNATLHHSDCLDVLPTLNGIDAVVTDPPYHLTSIVKRFGADGAASAQFGSDGAFSRASRGFMGKQWDGGDVAFNPETWRLVLDAMKPGAFLVAFASTRGYHRMTCAIEDAGFVIHPMLGWIFGTGFPKATRFKNPDLGGWRYGLQALKPALEPICMAQKPIEGTGSANWDKYGCGGLNIDACRVATNDKLGGGGERAETAGKFTNEGWRRPWMDDPESSEKFAEKVRDNVAKAESLGRWPANLLHDGSDEVLEAFAGFGERGGAVGMTQHASGTNKVLGKFNRSTLSTGGDGVRDTGTAARFFYSAKASAAERAGSKHPTVKPLALMRWLCTLVTPPGGTILDPFSGSGTTLQAASECGFSAIGIEREEEYFGDIVRRLTKPEAPVAAASDQPDLFA